MENTVLKSWTINSVLIWLVDYFTAKDFKNAKHEAELILANLLGISRIQLYLDFDRPLSAFELAEIKKIVKRRLTHEPLAYIIGKSYFWKFNLSINNRLLIPRRDSEILIEAVLNLKLQNPKILDFGTGSGALAIALALEMQTAVFALDKNADILDLAKENAKLVAQELKQDIKINTIQSNSFESLKEKDFNLIVSNPPYIALAEYDGLDPEVKQEPLEALLAGTDGCDFYRLFAKQAADYLAEQGYLCLEHGYNQKNIIQEIFKNSPFKLVSEIKDYSRLDRVLIFQKS